MESLLLSPKGVPMELTDSERGQLPQSWGRVLTPEEIAALADPSVYSGLLYPGRGVPAPRRRPRQYQINYDHPLAEGLEVGPAAT